MCSDSLSVIPEGKGLANGTTRHQIQVKTENSHADEFPCPGLCHSVLVLLENILVYFEAVSFVPKTRAVTIFEWPSVHLETSLKQVTHLQ